MAFLGAARAPGRVSILGLASACLGILVLASLICLGAPFGTALASGVVCSVCLIIAETDRRTGLIPDGLVVAIALVALAMALQSKHWVLPLTGAILMGGLFLIVRQLPLASNRLPALGFGDVKLAGAAGALVGPSDGLLVTAVAGMATAVILLLRPRNRTPALGRAAPFGVALAAALAIMFVLRSGCAQ